MDAGSAGAGVIYGSGPRTGFTNGVWLGTTQASIERNYVAAANHLGAFGLLEASPAAVAATAVANHAAWFTTTPSGAVANNDLTLAAAAGVIGGPVADAISSLTAYADLTAADATGGAPTAADANSATGATGSPTAGDVNAATGADTTGAATTGTTAADAATAAANIAKLVNVPVASGQAGDVAAVLAAIWDFLTTPVNWLRILEFVGGTVLVYMALHSMSGVGPGATTIVEAAAVAR